MWRLGNWISCRKELDFIKSQYREHARASIFLQSLKEHFKVKSGVLSKMSVNWVRFPCCSAGPTSAALISSNISQNQPTPHPALHKCTSVHCKYRLKITLLTTEKQAVQICGTYPASALCLCLWQPSWRDPRGVDKALVPQFQLPNVPSVAADLPTSGSPHSWWERGGARGLEVRTA